GRVGGRPKIMDEGKIKLARTLVADNSRSIGEICEILGVSKATLYRYIRD
ncbi:Hin recombinase, partial [bacterium]|nr:Hin recombinase [bacterium]